jgi:hypothetical protein
MEVLKAQMWDLLNRIWIIGVLSVLLCCGILFVEITSQLLHQMYIIHSDFVRDEVFLLFQNFELLPTRTASEELTDLHI